MGQVTCPVRFVLGGAGLSLGPSAKMRPGDFSELLDPAILIRKSRAHQRPAVARGVYRAGRQWMFPWNIIPADRLSPNGIGILNAWPVPNLTDFISGGIGFAAKLHTFDQRKDTLAVDVNATDKHRFRFRFTNYTYLEYQPLDGNTDRTPKFFDRPNKTSSLDYVWTISSSKVNEALITASEDVVKIPVDTQNFSIAHTRATVPWCRAASTIPTSFPTAR